MPFGVETFMAPSNYVFSNRSFIGKADVATTAPLVPNWPIPLPSAPLLLEAGVFNPRAIGDHNDVAEAGGSPEKPPLTPAP